eukprot:scaffold244_cov172-Amphora_coffeaeformis.AAC.30
MAVEQPERFLLKALQSSLWLGGSFISRITTSSIEKPNTLFLNLDYRPVLSPTTTLSSPREGYWMAIFLDYLAVNKRHCGQGAERIAFRCFLAAKEREDSIVFEAMVAKETNLV